MSLRLRKFIILTGAALLPLSGNAVADMGKPPVDGKGTYFSIEGGYLYQDQDGVIGHGISTSAAPAVVHDVIVSPDDGWFIGGMIGFSSDAPVIDGLHFKRIEAYALYTHAEDEDSATAPPLGGTSYASVDGTTTVGPDGTSGTTTVERSGVEGGLRFERDTKWDESRTLTWVVAPFIRYSDEETETNVAQCCAIVRTGDVDTWLYGVTFAVEPTHQIAPGLALVGRLGAGVYGYSADGHFASYSDLTPDILAATVNDDSSGVGFRGQLGAALKFTLGHGALLETFAEADYFSDVGTAALPSNVTSTSGPARVDSTDLWELRAGLRVTFTTDK